MPSQERCWCLILGVACLTLGPSLIAADGDWSVKLRQRVTIDSSTAQFRVVERAVQWEPEDTAVVVVDMWDNHHCKSAARRVGEMAPHMNRVLKAARDRGVLIIHAPSNCMDWYKGTPQRERARKAPFSGSPIKFQWNYFNSEREGPLAAKLEQEGCSCDTPQPCGPSYRAWKRQIASIEVGEGDAISDDGQEIYNLLEQRDVDNVIVMGVHTNRCVLGRPFGIRQMAYLGKNVVLCRDLTDSYHRDPGRHFEGLDLIVQHVEKYWCPSINSHSITGKTPFRFHSDRRRK